ncbi:hypothetical protein B0H13DRAFT_1955079 [Mycena leptocephala]|nr:hypothetical protein B0H13DRAFT_1955079 [Mycena leptocephala]
MRPLGSRNSQDAERYTAALVEKGILKPGDHPNIAALHRDTGRTSGEEKVPNKRLRMRIAVKRVDHIERTYRTEERVLFVQDYGKQQVTDRETFAAIQTAPEVGHKADLETKQLARMMPDYEARAPHGRPREEGRGVREKERCGVRQDRGEDQAERARENQGGAQTLSG